MTDSILALIPAYGLPLLALLVYLGCFGLPVPSSLALLAAGAFIATGDMDLYATWPVSLVAAVAGDQSGFRLGRFMGGRLPASIQAKIDTASQYIRRTGGWAVYFSRWLVSPLGPYVNLALGADGGNWARFTLFGVAGEITWVTLYIGLGMAFSNSFEAISELLGNITLFLAMGALAVVLGLQLRKALRKP